MGNRRQVGKARDGLEPELLGERHRHALAAVLAQRMPDLVADHRGELGVARLELLDQAGIDGDLAARHAPGIDFR